MKTPYTRCMFFILFLTMSSGVLIAQDVIWGDNPGEGDFDGGMNGWTINPITTNDTGDDLWEWSATGNVSSGAFAGANDVIASPTAANGSMVLNYDFIVTGGNSSNVPNPIPSYQSELISPVIDASVSSKHLWLRFSQLVRTLGVSIQGYSFTSVAFSTDGGATWADPVDYIDLNPGLAGNAGANNTVIVPIPVEYSYSSELRMKFVYSGSFYYWAIDDVQVLERPDYDMRVNGWHAVAPYRKIPLSQVEPMGFMADIQNLGDNDVNNVNLVMDIEESGTNIYSVTQPYGTIEIDSVAENVSFGSFTPTSIGNYTGTYTVSMDEMDGSDFDNTASFNFEVTDTIFAKENGRTRGSRPGNGNWGPGELRSWTYGNHFYINNGAGNVASTASFVVDNGNSAGVAGLNISINLWKWTPPLQDWIDQGTAANYDCQPGDRERVGFGNYEIQSNDNGNVFRTVALIDPLTFGEVELEDSTHYVLMLEYIDSGAGNIVSFGASDEYDYFPAIFNSQQIGMPRMGVMLGLSSDLDTEPFSSFGLGRDVTPCVRLNVTEQVIINTDDLLSEDNTVELFPNPANDEITIDVNLVKEHQEAIIKVVDVRGAVVLERSFDELQNTQWNINTANWTNGTYFLHVSTKEGIKTKHFTVQH